jgi:hypothetical protein
MILAEAVYVNKHEFLSRLGHEVARLRFTDNFLRPFMKMLGYDVIKTKQLPSKQFPIRQSSLILPFSTSSLYSHCSACKQAVHFPRSEIKLIGTDKSLKKLHGLSPRTNYTDQATAACRRSDCQVSATWSA